MRELSVFVDESGDFGPYDLHAPFYIFTLVFHNQSDPINEHLHQLANHLQKIGMAADHCFHVGPIIRREEEYAQHTPEIRRHLFWTLIGFTRKLPVTYRSFTVEKHANDDPFSLNIALSRQLSRFLMDNLPFFSEYDRIIVYYDNGQMELSRIITSIFSTFVSNVQFRKVQPAQYRLFQVADLLCTCQLLFEKHERRMLSKSELFFVGTDREFKKNIVKPLQRKLFSTFQP